MHALRVLIIMSWIKLQGDRGHCRKNLTGELSLILFTGALSHRVCYFRTSPSTSSTRLLHSLGKLWQSKLTDSISYHRTKVLNHHFSLKRSLSGSASDTTVRGLTYLLKHIGFLVPAITHLHPISCIGRPFGRHGEYSLKEN